MLKRGSLAGEQQASAIDVISRNATALARLVDDILDTSRIVNGKMRIELQPWEIARLINESVAAIRPAAESKGLRIEIAVEDGLVANCDGGRVGQILWNLLSNAVKFTPAGGMVTVTVVRRDENVSITVADTGDGISASDLPFVFQRFWQGEGASRHTTTGLGLGLALTRHLVELHGGRVSVTSDGQGRGARFEVLLPAHGSATS